MLDARGGHGVAMRIGSAGTQESPPSASDCEFVAFVDFGCRRGRVAADFPGNDRISEPNDRIGMFAVVPRSLSPAPEQFLGTVPLFDSRGGSTFSDKNRFARRSGETVSGT